MKIARPIEGNESVSAPVVEPTLRPGDEPATPDASAEPGPRGWAGRILSLPVLLPLMLVLALGALGWRYLTPQHSSGYVVPQSAAIEATWGIRFDQVDLVGDGGLVELGYIVLDSEKASTFQSDTLHPPLLHSEKRNATVHISALMKQGHDLRPGQIYFVMYQNPDNAIRPGERVTIDYKGLKLAHVPVR